jgi:hypothetical protein
MTFRDRAMVHIALVGRVLVIGFARDCWHHKNDRVIAPQVDVTPVEHNRQFIVQGCLHFLKFKLPVTDKAKEG